MKNKPKILIFLDEEILSEAYSLEFVKFGFEVKLYKNYDNLIELVNKEKPDMVFCGTIASGEINGIEAIQILSNNKKMRNVSIITPINLEKEQEVQSNLNLGARRFYIKEEYDPKKVAEGAKKYLVEAGKFTLKDFK